MKKEIDEIIKGCKKGRPDSQKKLYDMFSKKMYGVCLQYAKDYTEAEDVLQEGFIKVFTKINQYDGKGAFGGWIRRIMVNCALEKFRKQNNLFTVSEICEYDSKLVCDDILAEISSKELLDMIQELTPQYRTVFNLYAIEGYPHQEIAEMLNITEGTSKSNLSRARVILQEKVKELYSERKSNVKLKIK